MAHLGIVPKAPDLWRILTGMGLLGLTAADIVATGIMSPRVVAAALLCVGLAAPPLFAQSRSDAKEQVEFGIQVAQRGLWREAIYRWERATQLDSTYAAAFNNLAIAYEHEGELEKARGAYEKALSLEPENALIKQNFDLFKEINDRAAKKDPR
jgi:Tfp pilus assembly protein PilF